MQTGPGGAGVQLRGGPRCSWRGAELGQHCVWAEVRGGGNGMWPLRQGGQGLCSQHETHRMSMRGGHALGLWGWRLCPMRGGCMVGLFQLGEGAALGAP